VEKLLRNRTDVDDLNAARLAAASDGSPGRALLMAAEGADPSAGICEVLQLLQATESPEEVMAVSSELAKRFGSDAARLSAALRGMVHDMLRDGDGAKPLHNVAEELPEWRPSRDDAAGIVSKLCRAESRIKRHVPPAMALLPALLSLRAALQGEDLE
jgi:hypothetical protein